MPADMSVRPREENPGQQSVDAAAGTASAGETRRIVALDQFRGYTVAAMFLVNFMGGYAVCPLLWQHHNTFCSYADTIMPQFFFAAGFSLRLSFLRRQQIGGRVQAWRRMMRRVVGLALVAIAWYAYGESAEISRRLSIDGTGAILGWLFKSPLFQTLLHIAVTSLWILPVVGASLSARLAYTAASMLLHLLLSHWFYFEWVHTEPQSIDGGPFGFLTWTIPTIAGTIAYDIWRTPSESIRLRPYLSWGVTLAVAGWLLSCLTTLHEVPDEDSDRLAAQQYAAHPVIGVGPGNSWRELKPAEPPFVPPPSQVCRKENYWMMSQQHGTPSYLVFSAGLSFLVFAVFVWLAAVRGVQIGFFGTLGVNALAGYILHSFTGNAIMRHLQHDSSASAVYAGFVVYFMATYLLLRLLEWTGIRLRM
jgi:predicted acyltransferase